MLQQKGVRPHGPLSESFSGLNLERLEGFEAGSAQPEWSFCLPGVKRKGSA